MENRGWWIVGFALAICLALGIGAVSGGGLVYAVGKLGDMGPAAKAQSPDAELGIVIGSVVTGGPAAGAGVVRGDILLEVDDEPVGNAAGLVRAILELEPGSSVELKVLHGDEVRTLDAEVAEENGRAYLGVVPCCGMSQSVSIEEPRTGARIEEVVPGGPAGRAGIEVGDTIIAVNGREPGMEQSLAAIISSYEPGDTVQLVVQGPDAVQREVSVELGQHPEDKARAYLGVRYSTLPGGILRWKQGAPPDEFDLDDLPFDLPERGGFPLDLPKDGSIQGAVIREVMEDSPAAGAGLEQNDVIVAIDGENVAGPQALSETIADRRPGDSITLTVLSLEDQAETIVSIILAEHPDDGTRAYLGVVVGGSFRIQRFWDDEQPGGSEGWDAPFGFELPFDELPFEWPQEGLPFDWHELLPHPDSGDQSA